MLRCGKTAQTAIAAMSALAEIHDGGQSRLSSIDIAQRRDLSAPLVAKLLSILSVNGLVLGTRGPGGGYWLARDPKTITLAQIVEHFEKDADGPMCPFGPKWCGHGEPCPLHENIERMNREWQEFLDTTTLAVFKLIP